MGSTRASVPTAQSPQWGKGSSGDPGLEGPHLLAKQGKPHIPTSDRTVTLPPAKDDRKLEI